MKRPFFRTFLALTAVGVVAFGFGAPALAVDFPSDLPLVSDRESPFDLIGQVYFTNGSSDYLGSATVIRPSSILTAGHNVYDPTGGWSTNFEFRRGAYGKSVLSTQYATHLYVVAGYQTAARAYGQNNIRTFAYDTAGVIFAKPLAGGGYAGYSDNSALLSDAYSRIGVGYGAEDGNTGLIPLFVIPTSNFEQVYGAFFENTSIYFESGMSGGPLLAKASNGYLVAGVIVSSSTKPVAGGLRIIDATAVSFIQTYLK